MNLLSNPPLLSTRDNTQKYRITLSANAVRILEALALQEINTIGKHSPQLMTTLKELYLAATKTTAKMEVGMGVSYNTSGQVGISIEDKIGLDTSDLSINSNSVAGIKTESQMLMELSEEDRKAALDKYQQDLMKELGV